MPIQKEVIGACTLYLGDAAEVLPLLPRESVALGVTSPPYDQLRRYGGHSWDFEAIATTLATALCPGGVLVWIVQDSTVQGQKTCTSFRQALYFVEQCGLSLHDAMIYHKANPGGVRGCHAAYYPAYDFMFIFRRGPLRTFHPLEDRKNVRASVHHRAGGRQPNGSMRRPRSIILRPYGRRTNIWTYPREKGEDHPAVFPVALARDHVRSWSNPGETILDPFMGRGTTGEACVQLGCAFVGIEIEERYFQRACQRITDALKQLALFPAPVPMSSPTQEILAL